MGRMGEGIVREFGIDLYTLLHFKWITNKLLPYSTGDCSVYVATWMRKEFREERIHV